MTTAGHRALTDSTLKKFSVFHHDWPPAAGADFFSRGFPLLILLNSEGNRVFNAVVIVRQASNRSGKPAE
jgi:hypothetical protein